MEEVKKLGYSFLMGGTGDGKNRVLLWWAGACSVKLSSNCLLMGGVVHPPWYFFDLRLHSPQVYGLYGLTPRGTFPDFCCPHPCDEPLLNHTSTGDPPTPADSFGSVSCGVTAPFLWVLLHARFYLCPPRLESLFPPLLWTSCNQISLAFKVRFLGKSQSLCWIPRLEAWYGVQNLHNSGRTSLVLLFSSISGGYGIWFYHDCAPPTILLWFLLCLWMWGIFFGRSQHPPVDGCSTARCDFGAFEGGDEHMSFYSTILNWKPQLLFFIYWIIWVLYTFLY